MLFMAPQSGDFRPLNAAAQLVDAGTSAVNDVVTDDLDGIARPQGAAYDIGCFEGDFSTAVRPIAGDGVSMTVQGRELVLRGATPGSSIEWLDGSGRMINSPKRIEGDTQVPIPSVAWCLAVLRDGSGAVMSRQRVVLPER